MQSYRSVLSQHQEPRRDDRMKQVNHATGNEICLKCRRDFPAGTLTKEHRCLACHNEFETRIREYRAKVEAYERAEVAAGRAKIDSQGYFVEL